MADEKGATPKSSPPQDLAKPETRTIDVRELFADGREVVLIHAGEHYRLRITANDKLILTK